MRYLVLALFFLPLIKSLGNDNTALSFRFIEVHMPLILNQRIISTVNCPHQGAIVQGCVFVQNGIKAPISWIAICIELSRCSSSLSVLRPLAAVSVSASPASLLRLEPEPQSGVSATVD